MSDKTPRPDDPYPWRGDPDYPPAAVELLDKLADLGLRAADLMDADTDPKTGIGKTRALGAVGCAIMEVLSLAEHKKWDLLFMVGSVPVMMWNPQQTMDN